MRKLTAFFLVLTGGNVFCQQIKNEIWLMDIVANQHKISIANGKRVSVTEGYNNQPGYSPDSKIIYYVSGKEATQTEIYAYTIATQQTKQFTNSNISKYSPKVDPDRKGISAVVVETDKRQRIWEYLFSRAAGYALFPKADSIGYYVWVNPSSVMAYILPGEKPKFNKLVLVNGEGNKKEIAQNIGRGMGVVGRSGLFIKKRDSLNYIAVTDFKKYKELQMSPGKSEDFTIYKNYVLMASEGIIYSAMIHFKENEITKIDEFILLEDLTPYGLKNITRIAASPDGKNIALVNTY